MDSSHKLYMGIMNFLLTKLRIQVSIPPPNKKFRNNSVILLVSLILLEINSYAAIITSTSTGGAWSVGSTWIGGVAPVAGDDAVIATTGGNTINLGANSAINNLTINNGAILNGVSYTFTVSGNLLLNGTFQGNGTSDLVMSGNGVTIDGTGTINNAIKLNANGMNTTKIFVATANIIFTGANQEINIAAKVTITNNGAVTLKKISGANATTSGWINGNNSILNISEELLSTGTFTATASENTVNYNGVIPQTIKAASYYHLIYSGSNTLTLNDGISVSGNFTVTSGSFVASTLTSVTFNGSTAQNISGAAMLTFYNLFLNNTSGTIPQFMVNTDITTINQLNMTSGVVNLTGHTFILGESGTGSVLTRTPSTTTNWMYGGIFKRYLLNAAPVSSTTANPYGLFPLGISKPSSYRPVELNSTGNITCSAGFFTAVHIDSSDVTDLNPVYNDAGTDITRIHDARFITSISGATAGTFSISATMTDLKPGTLSDIRLAIFTGGTTASAVGTHASATGTSQNPTAKRTAITTLSDLNNDFRLSSSNLFSTPLPIQLLSFEAMPSGNIIEIKWSTASEKNNDYFTIEKSKDGLNFETVSSVDGAGNSTSVINYKLQDYQPFDGHSYYRLSQTDFDGTITHSDLVNANFNRKPDFSFKIYPNPNDGVCINLDMIADPGKETHLVMSDVNGKEIYSKEIIVSSNEENIYTFCSEERLAPGIYFVKISSSNKEYTKKIVVE